MADITPTTAAGVSPKSRLAAALLALFLGPFGIHRLYVGRTGSGILMLVLGLLGIPLCFVLIGFVVARIYPALVVH